jgi:hypothetical protein
MSLDRFIGLPYCPRRMDCADLAMLVQRELFGKAVLLPGKRPRPLTPQEQDAAIDEFRDELGYRVEQPQDGDAVLMREPGAERAGHIGTFFFINYAPHVLHTASWMQGGSTLHRLQDLSGLGLTIEGYYRWK